jgi:coenzyme PQQ biosynthesis protein PqqD
VKLSHHSRPRLLPKARLRFDRRDGRWLLLYPERGLLLSDVGAAIVKRCDGSHSLAQIVSELAAVEGAPPLARVEATVASMLVRLAARGLIAA